MKLNQRTITKPTERKPTELKGVDTTKKISFDGGGDDPMLTDNCAKFFNSLCQASKDQVSEGANLSWAFESEEDFQKRMEAMGEAERENIESALKAKLARIQEDEEGLICFCGSPICSVGEFVPASSVRRWFGF